MSEPVISIIGTIYNQAKHAERVLDIWCRQRFAEPYELIVMDDGSTDGTRAMVEDIAARYPGRVRYFYFDAAHFTRNCTLLFNTAVRRLMRSDIAVIQWYDRIPGSLDALSMLYEPHRRDPNQLVTFLTRHIAGSSSREVIADDDVDRLLASVPWREQPASLAAIMGTPGGHCHPHTMNESACFSIRREHLLAINGYDERYYKVANYSNVEIYGRLKHQGLAYQILDEYTFHQPHPSARGDIQTPIEPDHVVVRNTRIRQNWGAILPADHVSEDRRPWTLVLEPAVGRPSWLATLSSDVEVLSDADPNHALDTATGRAVCFVADAAADAPTWIRAQEARLARPTCGCVAAFGGHVVTSDGRVSLDGGGADVDAVYGDLFCVPRRPAIANGLRFDTSLGPVLSRVDFSRQMAVWGGRTNDAVSGAGHPGTSWASESFAARWSFLG